MAQMRKQNIASSVALQPISCLKPDRLQPDPRSETRPGPPSKITPSNRPLTRAMHTREKPMLFPANFNFKAAVIDVAKLVDRMA
jgi:hypothetical protein